MHSTSLNLEQLGWERLRSSDPDLSGLLEAELQRQMRTLMLVASSSVADPSVLACEGSVLTNDTTEGYIGARYHGGAQFVDQIEAIAIKRAKRVFHARYANVQPHSGSSANEILMFKFLSPGDTILGLEISAGGHLTHGARPSVSGKLFNALGYGLDAKGYVDYQRVRELAKQHSPKMIICGASSYPRTWNFAEFRSIADEAGALLLADISHVAGLIAAGKHPSPIDHAHFTTTSTYKQLCGPRGGLILMGRDADEPHLGGKRSLSEVVQEAVFPFFQGTPHLNAIAAKARALDFVSTPSWERICSHIITNAQSLCRHLGELGYDIVTQGTDNHIVLIDLTSSGLSGLNAQHALEECGIVVNRNQVPGEKRSPRITSGIRLGTNTLSIRGMGVHAMERCAFLIHRVLQSIEQHSDSSYVLQEEVRTSVVGEVHELCHSYPLPHYPVLSAGS